MTSEDQLVRLIEQERHVVPAGDARTGELMTVAFRYKRPEGARNDCLEAVVAAARRALGPNLGFASAVAELGLLLTRSEHAGTASDDRLIERARSFAGEDPQGDSAGFVAVAEGAAALMRDARLQPR